MDFTNFLLGMVGSLAGISFFIIVLTIVLLAVGASRMEEIARKKGWEQRKYALWCFFLPLIGYPMVIALPDLNIQKQQETIAELLTELKKSQNAKLPDSYGVNSVVDDLPDL